MAAHFSLDAGESGVIGIYLCRITEEGWIVEQSWERLPPAARHPTGGRNRRAFPIYFWETTDAPIFM
jgi:hypothetical protein